MGSTPLHPRASLLCSASEVPFRQPPGPEPTSRSRPGWRGRNQEAPQVGSGPQAVRRAVCPSFCALPLTYPEGRGWVLSEVFVVPPKPELEFPTAG